MSKRNAGLFVLVVLLAGLTWLGDAAAAPASDWDIELFARPGCPRCAAAARFLDKLQGQGGARLKIRELDVSADKGARERLAEVARAAGVRALGVPAFLVRGHLLVGFRSEQTTGAQLTALLQGAPMPLPAKEEPGAVCTLEAAACSALDDEEAVIHSRLFGQLSARRLGLPLFTVVVGLLDGFNPCAMWVLLFLLSLLARLKSRRKMLLIGGTFVVASGAVYFAFMATWLNVFLLLGISAAVRIVLAGLAVLIGAINIKDFFAFKRGVSLSIPESAKPGFYRRVREIVQARSLLLSLSGAIVLAVVVNFIELPRGLHSRADAAPPPLLDLLSLPGALQRLLHAR
jgi:glutaredoxin